MRRLPDETLKYSGEVRLTLKAYRQCDIHRWNVLRKQDLCTLDPQSQEIFMRPEAGCGAELCGEMHSRKPSRGG